MISFDASVIETFTSLWQRTIVLDWGAVFFATYFPFLIVLVALILFFRERSWRIRLWRFFSAALAVLIARGVFTEVVRFLYARQRPFIALHMAPLLSSPDLSASFPSGHAAFFFALAFVMLFVKRRWGYWFLGFALLNSLGRVYAGVHWPTDILGGIVVGFVSAGIVWFLLLRNPSNLLEEQQEEEAGGEPEDSLFPKTL